MNIFDDGTGKRWGKLNKNEIKWNKTNENDAKQPLIWL